MTATPPFWLLAALLLLGRCRHGGRVVIHDEPLSVTLHIDETIPRGKRCGVAILQVRERVIAGINRGIAVHPYVGILERHRELGEFLKGVHKIVLNLRRRRAQSGGYRSPEDGVLGIA